MPKASFFSLFRILDVNCWFVVGADYLEASGATTPLRSPRASSSRVTTWPARQLLVVLWFLYWNLHLVLNTAHCGVEGGNCVEFVVCDPIMKELCVKLLRPRSQV